MSRINDIKCRWVVLHAEFCSRKFLLGGGCKREVPKIVSVAEREQYGLMQYEREKATGKKQGEQKPLGFGRKRAGG